MTEETAKKADEETKDELELEPEFEIEFEGNFQKQIIFSMKVSEKIDQWNDSFETRGGGCQVFYF